MDRASEFLARSFIAKVRALTHGGEDDLPVLSKSISTICWQFPRRRRFFPYVVDRDGPRSAGHGSLSIPCPGGWLLEGS